jgi:hypothetical protein
MLCLGARRAPRHSILFNCRSNNWSFDYFFHNAAKRPRRRRFAAYLVLSPIFSETLTPSAFQKKSAQFSQKSNNSAASRVPQVFWLGFE